MIILVHLKLLKLVSNMNKSLVEPIALQEYFVVQSVGGYIAIDQHSGGYPYDTDFSRAEKYSSLDKGVQSMKYNNGIAVVHCKVYGEVVQQCDIDAELRRVALAKLTPEEIRALGLV